ncbi:MAG TPA: enoyl-CoA hydratase/isomerase family protein [Acetobacteraceae bacterium]|nr:enoyl-CoA hydratase/isomerase family protein [Acetobacteraceae bacterium]
MTEAGLRIEQRGGVRWLILDRPRVNALNAALYHALLDALRQAASDEAVRALVLSSANDRIFSAGADLKEDAAPGLRASLLLDALVAVASFPKPVLVHLAGKAIGAGAMIALLADEIVCGPGAELSLPEIQHDMPTPIGAAVVAARAPHALVQTLVQAGEPLGAEAASRAGLVSAVVPAAELAEATQARAQKLGALPARAYAGNKAWINGPLIRSLHDAAAHAASLRGTAHAP